MNDTQVKCLAVLMGFFLIGFGPLSPTCLIGLFVVIARPRWFFELVQKLYRNAGDAISFKPLANCAAANIARIKSLVCLLMLLLLDIAPVPVTSSIGLYVVIARPKWFKALVEKIYCGVGSHKAQDMA